MDDALELSISADELGDARPLMEAASAVMQVRTVRWVEQPRAKGGTAAGRPADRTLEMRGRLLVDSERAYEWLSERFAALGYVVMLRSQGADQVVLAMEGRLPERAGRTRLALGLFLATLVSVLLVGGSYETASSGALAELSGPPSVATLLSILVAGLPFAASLLGILVAHEMGHFLVARWQKIPASWPYFIPMPISLLGTMGAVIVTKAPPRNRRALLALGAAGPLAGLVVAIPVLALGLKASPVIEIPVGWGGFTEGNSLVYAAMKILIFGRFLPSGNQDVLINSVALAGWAGLLVTGINLLPAGQLDGGHIAYALLGRHARWLTLAVFGALLGLSFLWQGWLVLAALMLLLGQVHSVPLNDVTPLSTAEKLLAVAVFLVFLVVFTPIPIK